MSTASLTNGHPASVKTDNISSVQMLHSYMHRNWARSPSNKLPRELWSRARNEKYKKQRTVQVDNEGEYYDLGEIVQS